MRVFPVEAPDPPRFLSSCRAARLVMQFSNISTYCLSLRFSAAEYCTPLGTSLFQRSQISTAKHARFYRRDRVFQTRMSSTVCFRFARGARNHLKRLGKHQFRQWDIPAPANAKAGTAKKLGSCLRSTLEEREQVGVNRVGFSRRHAVRKALVGFQCAISQQLCGQRCRIGIRHDLIVITMHY